MKNSEPLFKDYLSKWCDSVKYEHGIGSSYPDFSIWSQDDEPIAFWEIAEKEFTAQNANEIQQELDDIQQSGISVKSGYSEGYSVLQYKIKKKSAQFRGCGSIPGMLVYADWTNYYMPTKRFPFATQILKWHNVFGATVDLNIISINKSNQLR